MRISDLSSDADINKLKALIAAGVISEDDLSNSPISGSFAAPVQGAQNARTDLVNPGPQDGSQGVLPPQQFVRNESTGEQINFAPQPQGPKPTMMRVVGAGNGQLTQLSPEMGAAPQLDASRGQIDIPGVGRADYGKDGNAYIRNPDGTMTKVLLGYDAQGSQALNKQNLQNDLTRAEIAQKNEAVAASQQGRSGQGLKPPSGYEFTQDGGLRPIPGGPADFKQQGLFNQDTATLQNSMSDLDRLATAANELKNAEGLKGITGLRGALPNIPGTSAANAEALLNTLKSQVAFGVLQTMRNNSKTGGALGQVSDKEGQLLQSNLAALDKSQSFEDFQKNLQKIIDYTEGAKDRLANAYNLKYGGKAGQVGQTIPGEPARGVQGQSFNSMPPAAQFAGKRIRDSVSGTVYRSDGRSWIRE